MYKRYDLISNKDYANDTILRLSLVCKKWAQQVVPFLTHSTYIVNSKPLLSSYLKLSGYGLLYPNMLLPFNGSKMLNFIKKFPEKYPYSFESLRLDIDRRQVRHAPDSVIPADVYKMLITDTLHSIQFHSAQFQYNDMENLLTAIKQSDQCAITSIDLSNALISASSLQLLADIVATSKILVSLSLYQSTCRNLMSQASGSTSTSTPTQAFINALGVNKSILRLDIQSFDAVDTAANFFPMIQSLCTGSCPVEKLYLTMPSDSDIMSNYDNNGMFPSNPTISTLRKLKINMMPLATRSFITFIKALKKDLISIDLADSNFSSYSYEAVLQSLPNVLNLNISSCTVRDPGSQPVLHDENNAFSAQGGTHFQPYDMLFKFHTHLTKLLLRSFGMSDEEARHLFELLKSNHTVTHLNIGNNQLSCTNELVALICTNTTLSTLIMDHNRFCNEFAKLCLALKLSKSLTSVDLSSNQISDEQGVALSEYISNSTCIRHLKLARNGFRLLTTHRLGSALRMNRSLVTFDFSDHILDQIAMENILDGVCDHQTISVVVLRNVEGKSDMLSSLLQTLGLRCIVIF
ncbi:hypothetical protein SAMD00019534_071600 [Acytostelium subglobosum LB1]|uniref:hypothetical protein n=1 Tax=Acytostelium subglobosum LB1 TaxID=1410327 RepID=UPI0006450525|nr:hypothetical protein SAMD00019534_071600 [Acytostelium subglobosum LB1]GAM23985.1 hypothetical protein SAMD00019534_071600 [Acytostelium subglobosum LB1]|eukprot:XP_012753021.1 hypothetical protein SAMD00019534_071600 [Acytostelium subglobosum LB1]